METVMRALRLTAKLFGLALLAIYLIYWFMFSGYLALVPSTPGAWRLWFDTSGVDGLAGPLFLWFLTLVNPFTLALLYFKLRRRPAKSHSGASNADL